MFDNSPSVRHPPPRAVTTFRAAAALLLLPRRHPALLPLLATLARAASLERRGSPTGARR